MSTGPIVGYTYQADNYCPEHIVAQLTANPGHTGHQAASIPNAEQHLDLLARLAGVDREDEYTFDTDDFPKVIVADQVQNDEFCAAGHPMLEG